MKDIATVSGEVMFDVFKGCENNVAFPACASDIASAYIHHYCCSSLVFKYFHIAHYGEGAAREELANLDYLHTTCPFVLQLHGIMQNVDYP